MGLLDATSLIFWTHSEENPLRPKLHFLRTEVFPKGPEQSGVKSFRPMHEVP